jgi:D-tyrosyl-tRNA(Tyr) deacylase
LIGLLQRVSRARVRVAGQEIAAIGPGLLVLVGVERDDTAANAHRLAERLLAYRVFPDQASKMNLGVQAVGGGLLLVPQFTLAADTNAGNRPSFSSAAPPTDGERLFDLLVADVRASGLDTATGRFGADMQVELTNEGPVTFLLRVPPSGSTSR